MFKFQSKSLSYFTPQKLATAAENFQMVHQWRDEFEVTDGRKIQTCLKEYLYKPMCNQFYVYYIRYVETHALAVDLLPLVSFIVWIGSISLCL